MSETGKSDGSESSWFSKPKLALIMVPTFLYFMSLYTAGPLLQQIIIQLACDKNRATSHTVNDDDCNSSAVASQASSISLYVTVAGNIPSLLLAGSYAAIADRYGRKVAMLLPLIGWVIYNLALVGVSYWKPTYFLYLLLGASFLDGFMGSYTAYLMSTFSYIADITSNNTSTRAFAFSILQSSVFFAKVTGPLLGGFWAEYENFTAPVLCSVAMTILAFIWICFIGESLPSDAVSRSKPLNLNPLSTFRNVYLLYSLQPEDGTQSPLPWIGSSFFLYYIVNVSSLTLETVYFKHLFKWTPSVIGIYVATEGLIQTFSMVCVPGIVAWLSSLIIHDIFWIFTGYAARAVQFCAISFATDTTTVFLFTAIALLSGPLIPRTRAILSNSVELEKQAQILSAFAAIETLSTFFAPGCTAIYSNTVEDSPHLLYWIFSAVCIVSACLIIVILANSNLFVNLPDEDGAITCPLRSRYELLAGSDPLMVETDAEAAGGTTVTSRTVSVEYFWDAGTGTVKKLYHKKPLDETVPGTGTGTGQESRLVDKTQLHEVHSALLAAASAGASPSAVGPNNTSSSSSSSPSVSVSASIAGNLRAGGDSHGTVATFGLADDSFSARQAE